MAEKWIINGKNVLITGGASGLGAAYVEAFLKMGADNIAILDISEGIGKEYAEKLYKIYKNKVIFVKCDVSKEDEIVKSFQEVLDAFKRIDILINNAGVIDDSIDGWRTACDVNWQGLVSLTRKGISHMRKDGGGKGGTIVNVSSNAALIKSDFLPVYFATKAAVLHFGRCMSSPKFYKNTEVRILTMCLGTTDTPILNNIEPRFFDQTFTGTFKEDTPFTMQRIDSAVKAFLKMFVEGRPGSVWMSHFDEPGQDVTSKLNEAYMPLERLALPEGMSAPY